MNINLNIKEIVLSTTKFGWALPANAHRGCGRLYQVNFPVERQWGCLHWFQLCQRSRAKCEM